MSTQKPERETTLKEEVDKELAVRKAADLVPESRAERVSIISRYNRGEKKLEAQALACVRAAPGEYCINYGRTVSAILDRIGGGNAVVREIVAAEVKEKRKELVGTGDTPPTGLESLLIDRILACWMQVSHYERTYYSSLETGMNLKKAEWMERRMDAAHRRYISSIKALAQVRKLQLPSIQVALPGSTQVNVGDKQVNLAQTGATQVNTGTVPVS